ncbi:uncharacterized protein LOC133843868 [Drosophila sulfurigaster albostrigata]|uniref:uncharacterized protein LOC133843868 n=1 Tax=Drosophila sulfurigaster albostrigata TaxID=89887 RepID=UPI002D21BF5E|nr:uncharacterized protein LOC133843868 [Drosophila sulfurigaster albostrigata]
MVKTLEKVACMRLQTAGVVVGWLGVVFSSLAIIITACAVGHSDKIAGVISKILLDKTDQHTHDTIQTFIVLYGSFYLGVCILHFLAAGFLVIGAMKNRHLMLLPWLVLNALGVFLNILSLLLSTFDTDTDYFPYFFRFLATFIYSILYVYIYWGIVSLYHHIQMNKDAEHEMTCRVAEPLPQNAPLYNVYSKI